MAFSKLVISNRPNSVGHYTARNWVLDIGDSTPYVGVDIGAVFKSTVASGIESAIFEHDIVHITQRLLATDVTTHKFDIGRMPRKVFAIEN